MLWKLAVGKRPETVSPFATGGGGVRFELRVAVQYVVSLLRQEVPRGIDGIVQEIHLQQRNLGNPVDDIIVDCKSPTGTARLFLQAKHSLKFSSNTDFAKVIDEVWRQFSGQTFTRGRDRVGVAIGEASNNATVRHDVSDVLDWARTSSSAKAFYSKVSGYVGKTRVVKAFEQGVGRAVGRRPTQAKVQTLLKHFVVVPFDFSSAAGRDNVDCRNRLIDSVGDSDARSAAALFAILYNMVSEYATQAGDITRKALSERISASATFTVPILQRAGGTIDEVLSRRLHNRINAEKNSKKYMPQVFVEVDQTKERARLFCDPVLFLRRVAERVTRVDLFELNRLITKAGLKPVESRVSTQSLKGTFASLEHDVQCLANALNRLRTSLASVERNRRSAVARRVPKAKKHVYKEVCWRIGDMAYVLGEWGIEPLLKDVELARARVFAVVSRAGQGKTNFMCDFAVNCLAKRRIPCAFFTGKELGMAARGQLCAYVARAAYGDSVPGNLEALLADIDDEASRKGTLGVILIDAVNEHPDLPVFSRELEGFIEKCLEFAHIRVMLTCRSEYFDARFGNLTRSSFADRLVVDREIHEQMGAEHRKRLITGYFSFFRIRSTWMSEHVHRQFGEDPFLLRVFCEAYGNPTAKSEICVGRLTHIRREALFREYFRRKFQAIQLRTAIKTGFLIGTHHPYQMILRSMVEWMVQERRFSDVPLNLFAPDRLDQVTQLLDEDILVRRDITRGSVLATTEVINFTFDACRDFLLADYILNVVFHNDPSAFKDLVRDLTDEQSTVAEGLQHYLFYASRHLQDPTATTIIKRQSWYDTVFASSVFDLEDSDLTEEDVDKLRSMCLSGDDRAAYIAINLLINCRADLSPRANIRLLFGVFDAMSDGSFDDLCKRAFASSRWRFSKGLYPINRLVEDIRSIAPLGKRRWPTPLTDLMRLLLYLWGVPGPDLAYPARGLFDEFAEQHPRIAARLRREHVTGGRKGYSGIMQRW